MRTMRRRRRLLVVNETFARRFWPGQNPMGKRIVVGRGPDTSEVVGVSGDVRNKGLARGAAGADLCSVSAAAVGQYESADTDGGFA